MTTNVPGDEFRRLELVRQLHRLADLVLDTPGLTPAIGQAPWVEFHVASETLVNAVAHRIGQFPQHYKGQYFVDLDAVELRARWTYTLAAEPEISDPLGLGDGFDRSQTADVDETPVPVVGRRYEPHTGGLTEGGLVDETPAAPDVFDGLPDCSPGCTNSGLNDHLDDCPRGAALGARLDRLAETPEQSAAIVDSNLRAMGSGGLVDETGGYWPPSAV